MAFSERHIENITRALTTWFDKENRELSRAIEQTVDENLFSLEDIKHQILSLKHTISKETLKKWVADSHVETISREDKNVLCLHAGNVPLVGIQDLIAVLLRNGTYIGKLSRKDPYLMASLLRHLAGHGLVEEDLWSVTPESLKPVRADALLFAGSEQSAGPVKEKLTQLGLIGEDTPSLMRTAGFSMAYIEDESSETYQDLTEAIFRYGGAGCRSVAIVVSPFPLRKVQCGFTDYIESFWLANPPHHKVSESVPYRFALNKALGIDQAWLDHFLMEESGEISGEKHIVHWMQGDLDRVEEIIRKMGSRLQSVYSTADYIGRRVGERIIEPLSLAQMPPIWWKPDNVNTLVWLQDHGI